MASVCTTDPEFQSALSACTDTLQRLADYELDASLERRLRDLGDRKEFLNSQEHEELLALVAFAQKRTVEKLEARVALQRLRTAIPGLVADE